MRIRLPEHRKGRYGERSKQRITIENQQNSRKSVKKHTFGAKSGINILPIQKMLNLKSKTTPKSKHIETSTTVATY